MIKRPLWRQWARLGLILLALPLLAACGMLGTLSGLVGAPAEVAQRCAAWDTPRTYVGCLADDLKAVADEYVAASKASQISRQAFLAAEPYVDQARDALNDAGKLLQMAATGREQAALADSPAKQKALETAAATVESSAILRAAVAEDRVRWLKDSLARARAPPPAPLTTPAPTPLLPPVTAPQG